MKKITFILLMLFAFIFVWASMESLSYPKDKKARTADSLVGDSLPIDSALEVGEKAIAEQK